MTLNMSHEKQQVSSAAQRLSGKLVRELLHLEHRPPLLLATCTACHKDA